MKIEFIPLLHMQRELYDLPRGIARFREYLRTMIDPDGGDIALPLSGMNPMGKQHVPLFLDALLAMDADGAASAAAADAARVLAADPGAFSVCLVVSDDLMGGWTNRYTSDFAARFKGKPFHRRGWIPVPLWVSERYDAVRVRGDVLTCIHRTAYIQRHGQARTLDEMLAQEGHALARAGATEPALDEEDLAYTRDVLAPHRETHDHAVLLPALYGDPAARALGYHPLGLSPWAGIALALAEAARHAG